MLSVDDLHLGAGRVESTGATAVVAVPNRVRRRYAFVEVADGT
jgi:hypothetical protein